MRPGGCSTCWGRHCVTNRRSSEAPVSQQINLYNPLFLKQEKYFSARTMTQALGLIALGLLGLYAYAFIQSRAGERTADEYRRQAAAQQEQAVNLTTRLAAPGRSPALEADVGRLD